MSIRCSWFARNREAQGNGQPSDLQRLMKSGKSSRLVYLIEFKWLAIGILILAASVITFFVSARRSEVKNRQAIHELVVNTPGLRSTNLTTIKFTDWNHAEVYTLRGDGNGGDLLTVEKRDNQWRLSLKGAWMN